jgi:hypothetical protein
MNTPTEEQIRKRAYEIYRKHGKPGRDLQNWLEAERELKQMLEREQKAEGTVWEDTSTGRGTDGRTAVTNRSRREEYKKGF